MDTGHLLALELKQDQHHVAALQHWRRVQSALPALVTMTYVFDEVVTFFNSRGYYSKAVEVGTRLMRSPSVQLVHVDAALSVFAIYAP